MNNTYMAGSNMWNVPWRFTTFSEQTISLLWNFNFNNWSLNLSSEVNKF